MDNSPFAAAQGPTSWQLEDRPDWLWDVTAKELRSLGVHRWFFFPHSFAPALVANLTAMWHLNVGSVVADPYCGAGTTLVTSQQLGYQSIGWDISPLAVFASRVKLARINADELIDSWSRVATSVRRQRRAADFAGCDQLVRRALPDDSLAILLRIWSTIQVHEQSGERVDSDTSRPLMTIWDALRLAVLAELPKFSRLVRKGGWLAKQEPTVSATSILNEVGSKVRSMALDLAERSEQEMPSSSVRAGDARSLACQDDAVDAIITSPPYPNRHDYTRIFGVELAFGFLNSAQIRELRYQSLSSHPEAKPQRPECSAYQEPPMLTEIIGEIGKRITDPRAKHRIPAMIRGYFLDLWLSLRESRRVLRPGGHAAFVVGNAQYQGVTLEVDTWLAAFGQDVGMKVEHIYVARRRGNSAQQMRSYGRQPQRESVVILQAP